MTPTTFPERWAPQHPDRIQLYSIATPNGKKVGVVLEELGLPYEPHRIDIMNGDQFDPEFVAINPNSKIPAIIDPYGDEGRPLAIMESGAILLHLADRAGRLAGSSTRARSEVMQWLFFQVGSVGPMFGQYGHFYRFAKGKTDDYGEKRYGDEVKRLLGVIDRQLEGREWLVEDYSIADIATAPWVDGLEFYGVLEEVDFASFENVVAWLERFKARPGVQRGYEVCAF
jgi:GST-like protein